jgi:hypothetical protein
MDKIYEQLIKKTNDLYGDIIVIGIDSDKLSKKLESNNNIVNINYLSADIKEGISLFSNPKNINVRKFRKQFKHKKHDFLICNNDQMRNYYKYFIKDSIYMTKTKIYLIGSNEEDIDLLFKRYSRYSVTINKEISDNNYLLIIDVKDAKNNKIKDAYYYFKDTLYNMFEYLSNFLIG